MVTQITEAPHSARRAKQLFTVVLPLLLLKLRCSIEDECLLREVSHLFVGFLQLYE